MERSKKLLLVGGVLLIIWGMTYGLYYALIVEHPMLEAIARSLARSFSLAAERQLEPARAALDAYAAAKHNYVREVDVHSHWSGLALLLVLFGLLFDQVAFAERTRLYLAAVLVAGSFLYPASVLLQTFVPGFVPQALAAAGAALLIMTLVVVAAGMARRGK